MREPPVLQQVDRTYVLYHKRKLSYFSGCDYFRLASHPDVMRACEQGAKDYGLNVAASRSTSGNHRLYQELEKQLAGFFESESATLFSNGYMANLGVAQALAGDFSHVLLDERAHVSLMDAAKMLDRPVLRFRHRNPADLASAVRKIGRMAHPILLTDGLYAHDGSIAPLKLYLEILPRNTWLMVDDAHAAGVLGIHGRGSLEYAGVSNAQIVQTITLSKAFGVYGGAVLGTEDLRARILERSRLFAGNTPLPLPLAAGALEALKVVRSDLKLRQRLAGNVRHLKSALAHLKYEVPETPSPVVSLEPASERKTKKFQRDLIARGIYPPFIRYPGGPAGGLFRFAISSEHTKGQLDSVVEFFHGVIG